MVDPIAIALADDALRRMQKDVAGETAAQSVRARRTRRSRPSLPSAFAGVAAGRGLRAAVHRG